MLASCKSHCCFLWLLPILCMCMSLLDVLFIRSFKGHVIRMCGQTIWLASHTFFSLNSNIRLVRQFETIFSFLRSGLNIWKMHKYQNWFSLIIHISSCKDRMGVMGCLERVNDYLCYCHSPMSILGINTSMITEGNECQI